MDYVKTVAKMRSINKRTQALLQPNKCPTQTIFSSNPWQYPQNCLANKIDEIQLEILSLILFKQMWLGQ